MRRPLQEAAASAEADPEPAPPVRSSIKWIQCELACCHLVGWNVLFLFHFLKLQPFWVGGILGWGDGCCDGLDVLEVKEWKPWDCGLWDLVGCDCWMMFEVVQAEGKIGC